MIQPIKHFAINYGRDEGFPRDTLMIRIIS